MSLIKKSMRRIVFILTVLLLAVSCTQEDLVAPSEQNVNSTQTRMQKERSAYEIAIEKLHKLQRQGFNVGKKMNSSPSEIIASYPLWTGDTGTIVNPPFDPNNPGEPGDVPSVAQDSIYAYVFDFANMEGSVVIGVDENIPDILVYTKGNYLFKGPRLAQSQEEQDENSLRWNEFLKETKEWADQCDRNVRQLLLEYTRFFQEEVTRGADLYREQIALWTAGDLIVPQVVRRDTVENWHFSRRATYPHGMCMASWYNMPPFTDELIRLYGPNINCWDIIPTVARYLSCIRPSTSYNGWPLRWNDWIGLENGGYTAEQQEQILNEIGHLYTILGSAENLNVNYNTTQNIEVFNNVSRTLSNFGMQRTGVIEKEYPTSYIVDEIENNHPCIAICETDGTIPSIQSGVFSILIDEYEERCFKESILYTDNVTI